MGRLSVLATLVLATVDCDPDPPATSAGVRSADVGSGAGAGVGSVVANGAAAALQSSGGAGPAGASPEPMAAGTWTGRFEAKRAPIPLDPGVKVKAWSADDGKTASGAGEIEVVVAATGIVSGKISGALGDGTLTGGLVGDSIRATLSPAPSDERGLAMSGTLVLTPKGQGYAGELRASSYDARTVRVAAVELARK